MLKKEPGKWSFATSGQASIAQMMGELFMHATGTDMVHVPYKGSGPAINDMLGGQIKIMFDNLPSSLQHIKAGKLIALAVAAPKRLGAAECADVARALMMSTIRPPSLAVLYEDA